MRRTFRHLAASLISCTLLGNLVMSSHPLYASMNTTGEVRVGLLYRTNAFDTSVDTVTLKDSKGLQVGITISNQFQSMSNGLSFTKLRGSLDDYYVVVYEGSSYTKAVSTNHSLLTDGYDSSIVRQIRNGTTIFQVVAGFYDTSSQANTALQNIKSNYGSQAHLNGWYRLNAGSFNSYTEALTKVSQIQA